VRNRWLLSPSSNLSFRSPLVSSLWGAQQLWRFLNFLVCDYSEIEVKVIDTEDPTKTWTLRGHSRQVLSVAFDPTGRYLVSDPNSWLLAPLLLASGVEYSLSLLALCFPLPNRPPPQMMAQSRSGLRKKMTGLAKQHSK